MDSDLNLLLRVQPTLNPWLVVLLGSIAGLLAFAISSALHVRHKRNRRSSAAPPNTLAARTRQTIIVATIAYVLLMLARAIPGPTLVDGRGWLSGEDLFTVAARPGFLASYPDRAREVKQGDTILHLVRDAGPDEIAAAASRRSVLLQDLEFARLEMLRVDPLLLAAHTTTKEQLQELRSALHELEQTASSLKAAVTSFEIANRPKAKGLFSGDEVAKRAERVEVLRSRHAALKERIALLTGDDRRAKAADGAQAPQSGIGKLEARVVSAWRAIEQDKIRAERQQQHRVRQIELRIAELDELLDPKVETLEVRAPWSGVVGFRESSPASVRAGNRPLLVLYRPGTLAAKLRIPPGQSAPGVGDAVEIAMQALVAEAASTTFNGTIAQSLHQPDGSTELLVAGDPPEAAVRELAQGNSVSVHTDIRHSNPMTNVAATWWALLAIVLGIAFVEIRHRRARRRAMAGNGASGENRWLGLNWGADAGEYLEYVMGVGIVPRRVRADSAAIKPVDDPHRVPESVAGEAALKSA